MSCSYVITSINTFILQEIDARHAEGKGEWDGVDLASAPCLQRHRVETDKIISPNRVEAADHAETLTTYSMGQRVIGDGEGPELFPARPATPPALLVYKPSLRYIQVYRL